MFSLDSFFNDIIYSKTISGIVCNPIYVSVLIVLIVLIIIFFMFNEDDDDDEDNFWKKMIKTGFYILIPTLIVIVLHYKNIEKEMEHNYENKSTENIVNQSLVTGNPYVEPPAVAAIVNEAKKQEPAPFVS